MSGKLPTSCKGMRARCKMEFMRGSETDSTPCEAHGLVELSTQSNLSSWANELSVTAKRNVPSFARKISTNSTKCGKRETNLRSVWWYKERLCGQQHTACSPWGKYRKSWEPSYFTFRPVTLHSTRGASSNNFSELDGRYLSLRYKDGCSCSRQHRYWDGYQQSPVFTKCLSVILNMRMAIYCMGFWHSGNFAVPLHQIDATAHHETHRLVIMCTTQQYRGDHAYFFLKFEIAWTFEGKFSTHPHTHCISWWPWNDFTLSFYWFPSDLLFR